MLLSSFTTQKPATAAVVCGTCKSGLVEAEGPNNTARAANECGALDGAPTCGRERGCVVLRATMADASAQGAPHHSVAATPDVDDRDREGTRRVVVDEPAQDVECEVHTRAARGETGPAKNDRPASPPSGYRGDPRFEWTIFKLDALPTQDEPWDGSDDGPPTVGLQQGPGAADSSSASEDEVPTATTSRAPLRRARAASAPGTHSEPWQSHKAKRPFGRAVLRKSTIPGPKAAKSGGHRGAAWGDKPPSRKAPRTHEPWSTRTKPRTARPTPTPPIGCTFGGCAAWLHAGCLTHLRVLLPQRSGRHLRQPNDSASAVRATAGTQGRPSPPYPHPVVALVVARTLRATGRTAWRRREAAGPRGACMARRPM